MKPCLFRHEIVGCLEIQPDLDLKYFCAFSIAKMHDCNVEVYMILHAEKKICMMQHTC